MITTLLVPGLDGSTGRYWQQWWLQNDPDTALMTFIDLRDPFPATMEIEVIEPVRHNPGCILVDHSLRRS